MRLLLVFTILGLLLSSNLMAQDRFIQICESTQKTPSQKAEFEWLSEIFKTNDCHAIADNIKTKKSFTEVLPTFSDRLADGSFEDTWMKDRPNYLGLKISPLSMRAMFDEKEFKGMFATADTLKEFTNLTHINFDDFIHSDVCRYVKDLPHLKLITINPKDFLGPGVEDCLAKSRISIVLTTNNQYKNYKSYIIDRPSKARIVGFENWNGFLDDLRHFDDLRYLNLHIIISSNEEEAKKNDFTRMMRLNNLSHLSITSTKIDNFIGIRYLGGLQFLSIVAARSSQNDFTIQDSFINDISFIADLPFLKRLVLKNHSFSDLSPLLELENLEEATLIHNNISNLGSLKSLKSLKKLDLSYNDLQSLENVADAPNLTYLKVVQNTIKDFTPLERIANLSFLNLSQTTAKKVILPKMKNLKYLIMDSYPFKHLWNTFNSGGNKIEDTIGLKEYNELLDLTSIPFGFDMLRDCRETYRIKELEGLKELSNLKFLSLTRNLFNIPEGLNILENLHTLNLAFNTNIEMPNLSKLSNLNHVILYGTPKIQKLISYQNRLEKKDYLALQAPNAYYNFEFHDNTDRCSGFNPYQYFSPQSQSFGSF